MALATASGTLGCGGTQHLVDALIRKRDRGKRRGRKIARDRPRRGDQIGDRIRVRQDDDLAAQPIVLAKDFLRLHLQQVELGRGSARDSNAVGGAEIRQRVDLRPVGQKHRGQRGDAGNGEYLPRRALRLLPGGKKRNGAERRHVDGARAHRLLQRTGAEEALVARL
jgi:hypothetical protein